MAKASQLFEFYIPLAEANSNQESKQKEDCYQRGFLVRLTLTDKKQFIAEDKVCSIICGFSHIKRAEQFVLKF